MATIDEIKKDLAFEKKISFFKVLNKEKEETVWNRATNPFSGDFLLVHDDALAKILEDTSIDTLFLKRKPDVTFEDGILHRVFVLCIGSKEAVANL